jgi:metal-responsive CopG/Arc/MetJ family transcriptional regulator
MSNLSITKKRQTGGSSGERTMRVVSFKIEEELLELLERYAIIKNMSKSEVIRRAIRHYISQNFEKPVVTKRIRVYS